MPMVRRARKSDHILHGLTDAQGSAGLEEYSDGTEISGFAVLGKCLGPLTDQLQGELQFESLGFALFHFFSCL